MKANKPLFFKIITTRSMLAAVSMIALTVIAAAASPAYRAQHLKGTIPGEAIDEAKSGVTLRGTPVHYRTDQCFPAEPRDLFWRMDWVVKGGKLVPLDFDEDGDGEVGDKPNPEFTGRDVLGDPVDRDAIRGRNSWLLWGGGNETFWSWLQEQGYGLTDFLILMDSRQRANRFKAAGLINQPGFEQRNEPILGLYLDKARGKDGIDALLRPPQPRDKDNNVVWTPYQPGYRYDAEPEYYDAQGRKLKNPVYRPAPPLNHNTELFEPWATPAQREAEWKNEHKPGEDPFKNYVPEVVREKLPYDGLDPLVYGYPSGIFGLRLMLNPDFFARTDAAATARSYWKKQVEDTNGRYYTETSIHSDPKLIRPFRVTMSCGFCHVAQHPLNPPLRDDEPEWENLSSIIGAQYWDPQPTNGNLLKRPNFLHHFLKSQAPGTIDTSLVSTDHINNTNVINPIFDVPARLTRALQKPTELQGRENLMLPSLEDPETSNNPDGNNKRRHFPTVLGPGEDSIGIFGALERVPHNVGIFSEEWFRTGNLVLGYTPQRPFRIEVGRANSVFWNVNVKYRVPYMARFFDLGHKGIVAKSTAAMKLKDAQDVVRAADGKAILDAGGKPTREAAGSKALEMDSQPSRDTGRKVFLDNCAICHSSKLPSGFDLHFTRDVPTGGWDKAPAPADAKSLIYTLPMEYGHWDEFRSSPAMADFRKHISEVAGGTPKPGEDDLFIKDNFLSNELRIPITLIGTYAGRALATNAMKGHVWDNYSSETFKNLPSVGKIRYFNPYSSTPVDQYGTNDQFDDGRQKGGPGYFRPATLISIWATAPFFHNNALGVYTHDTSVKGRLLAFDDGINKLLWKDKRPSYDRDGFNYLPPGDLRPSKVGAAVNDPGYIYRLPVDTRVLFQPGFIRPILEGLLIGYTGIGVGKFLFTVLSFWWWVILAVVYLVLIFKGRPPHAGLLFLILAGLIASVAALLELGSVCLWIAVAALLAAGFWLFLTTCKLKWVVRTIFILASVITLFVGILANKFLTGHLKKVNPLLALLPNSWLHGEYTGIDIGPIPRGTPVNLIMNLDPDKKGKVGPALLALVRAMLQINQQHLTGEQAYQVFAKVAGQPLMEASKCPDFVLDRGHWFGESLSDDDKRALIAFLKTL